MNYFLTGATGFLGRFFLERLLQREDSRVFVLVRSLEKFKFLQQRFPEHAGQLLPVLGDITLPQVLQVPIEEKIDHVFHLAAVYDMHMDDATADAVNNQGTRNVVNLANAWGARLHHVSSVAVAGSQYVGPFKESHFDQGQVLTHPYYRSKFESEKIVRDEAKVPYRIYRPGAVVGDSRTGEMDKIDGPYYFFKLLQTLTYAVPKWLPLLGLDGGKVAIAPVDYVASAMDALAHKDGLDGTVFHLFQNPSVSVGELTEIILSAAKGPEFASKIKVPSPPKFLQAALNKIPRAVEAQISEIIGVPVSVLGYITSRAIFEDKATRDALRDTSIRCPDLRDYIDKLWAYWELHLDIEKNLPEALRQQVSGKVAVITGASSGIGFNVARKLGAAGAKVVLVARTREKLEEAAAIIQKHGGEAYVFPCDLNNMEAIDACAQSILAEFGHVDILINNAGRSIRRAVIESLDRFHDFERTMQLNYFGAIRMVLAFLPSMVKQKNGHIINISSIGVLANAPRFAAYVASKAALDAFSRCLSAEVKAKNIEITAIYMPLVRTPMIAPTKMYDYVPTWSPDKAANTVVNAIVKRPKSIATAVGTAAALSYAVWPKLNDSILSKGFSLFPSSAAAKGQKENQKPSLEQVVFANVFKGEHW
jgi:NAD(P)-dependent dehydrogenase (short-subunit alcohol dehydrogenase family)